MKIGCAPCVARRPLGGGSRPPRSSGVYAASETPPRLVVADIVLQLGAARGVHASGEVAPRLGRLASAAMRLEEAEVERRRALPARRVCAVHQCPLRLRHTRDPPGLVVRAGLAATPRVCSRKQQPEPWLLWPQPQRGQGGGGGGLRITSRNVQRGCVGVRCRVGRVDGEGGGMHRLPRFLD